MGMLAAKQKHEKNFAKQCHSSRSREEVLSLQDVEWES